MIETERLRLAPPQGDDFEPSAAMFTDPRVVAHIGGKPFDRTTSWGRFLRDIGHWSIYGFGLFSIYEKATGDYVGKTGHARFQRDLGAKAMTDIEISWTLRSEYHGKGFATEAARAALNWFDTKNRVRTACLISAQNAPSLKLAARLGYDPIDQIDLGGDPQVILARDP